MRLENSGGEVTKKERGSACNMPALERLSRRKLYEFHKWPRIVRKQDITDGVWSISQPINSEINFCHREAKAAALLNIGRLF